MLLEELESRSRYIERLMLGTNGSFVLIKTAQIDWIEAEGNYARVHYGQTSALLRRTITNLEAGLSPARFLRISRSVIVNLDRVRELHRESHGEFQVIMHSDKRLTLSRHFREHLRRVVESGTGSKIIIPE